MVEASSLRLLFSPSCWVCLFKTKVMHWMEAFFSAHAWWHKAVEFESGCFPISCTHLHSGLFCIWCHDVSVSGAECHRWLSFVGHPWGGRVITFKWCGERQSDLTSLFPNPGRKMKQAPEACPAGHWYCFPSVYARIKWCCLLNYVCPLFYLGCCKEGSQDILPWCTFLLKAC